MTTKKLSEKTEQNPSEPQPHWSNNILGSLSLSNRFWSISVRDHNRPYSSSREKRPMDVYGWAFKLYVLFVWQLSGKNILFFTLKKSVSNAQFFFCQICVCNGTKKRIQHKEFSFLSFTKAIKTVSCITDFGVSTAIFTFFVGGTSWTSDTSIEAENCNIKLTKKFILVAV